MTLPDILMPVLAAAGGVTPDANPLPAQLSWLTSSIVVAVIVLVGILWFVKSATKDLKIIPDGKQNFLELVVEFLYGQVETIVGKKVAPMAFPLLGTLFIFILVSNYFGLLPGVGTVGWSEHTSGVLMLEKVDKQLLRPPTSDLNMTIALAVCSMAIWFWITMKETGPKEFFLHIFAPKGGLKGGMWWALLPIFIFVGFIEVVSIIFRPITLALRLDGNIFAGESLLHKMMHMSDGWGDFGSFVGSVLIPLPFYFMELLVGVLQALVFTMLVAVYIQLSTTHDESH